MTTILGSGARRKIRGDSKLDCLPAEQQALLRTWLAEENLTYAQVVDCVRTQFGVIVGKSAVGVYYQRHISPCDRDDLDEAPAILAKLDQNPLHPAALHRARILAWSALARPTPAITTATKLLKRVRYAERLQIAHQRLHLAERRLALREAQLAARSALAATSEAHPSSENSPQSPPLFPGYFTNIHPYRPEPRHPLSSPTGPFTHAATLSTPDQSGVTFLATAPPLAA